MKYLWMTVTPDEFEFPIEIESNVEKLAKKLGMNTDTVRSVESRKQSGKRRGFKIVKVAI